MPSTLHHTKPRSTLLAEMREEAMSITLLQQVRETTLGYLRGQSLTTNSCQWRRGHDFQRCADEPF
jgi:hypothetical protein